MPHQYRTAALTGLVVVGLVPATHWAVAMPESVALHLGWRLLLMFACYGGGAFFFGWLGEGQTPKHPDTQARDIRHPPPPTARHPAVTYFPERAMPQGHITDIWFNSHTIWHIFVCAAAVSLWINCEVMRDWYRDGETMNSC